MTAVPELMSARCEADRRDEPDFAESDLCSRWRKGATSRSIKLESKTVPWRRFAAYRSRERRVIGTVGQPSTAYALTGAAPFVTNGGTANGWSAGGGVEYAVTENIVPPA